MTAYETIAKSCGSIHRNKCIDGSITGQSCCVGYCNFSEHRGFLTKSLRKQHDCIKKGCHYYIPKQKTIKGQEVPKNNNEVISSELEAQITDLFSEFEGMKIHKIIKQNEQVLEVSYITITNAYSINDISRKLENETGYIFVWNRLNLDFDKCAQMIFQ